MHGDFCQLDSTCYLRGWSGGLTPALEERSIGSSQNVSQETPDDDDDDDSDDDDDDDDESCYHASCKHSSSNTSERVSALAAIA